VQTTLTNLYSAIKRRVATKARVIIADYPGTPPVALQRHAMPFRPRALACREHSLVLVVDAAAHACRHA
jgi:hypothetical protein